MSAKDVLAIDEHVEAGSAKKSQCDSYDREFRRASYDITFNLNILVESDTGSHTRLYLKVLKAISKKDGRFELIEDEAIEGGEMLITSAFSKDYRGDVILQSTAEPGLRYIELRERPESGLVAKNYKSTNGNEGDFVDGAEFIVVEQCTTLAGGEDEHKDSDETEDQTSAD